MTEIPEIVHLAGPDITMNAHLRQRCVWCGYVLIDQDLTRIGYQICGKPTAVRFPTDEQCQLDPGHEGDHDPEPHPRTPPTWPVSGFVAVFDAGGFCGYRIVEAPEGGLVPEGACLLLPPELTLTPEPRL